MACYTQRCVQGRQPCPTPYACSGLKTTCAISDALPVEMYDEQRPSMFASRWFWISAVACGLFYVGAWWLLS